MNHTFGASRLLKTAWIVLFVGGAWLCLVVRNQNDAWWLYVFLAGFLLFMYHCFWPHPIRFDDDGISQRNWWGKMKHIDWDDGLLPISLRAMSTRKPVPTLEELR